MVSPLQDIGLTVRIEMAQLDRLFVIIDGILVAMNRQVRRGIAGLLRGRNAQILVRVVFLTLFAGLLAALTSLTINIARSVIWPFSWILLILTYFVQFFLILVTLLVSMEVFGWLIGYPISTVTLIARFVATLYPRQIFHIPENTLAATIKREQKVTQQCNDHAECFCAQECSAGCTDANVTRVINSGCSTGDVDVSLLYPCLASGGVDCSCENCVKRREYSGLGSVVYRSGDNSQGTSSIIIQATAPCDSTSNCADTCSVTTGDQSSCGNGNGQSTFFRELKGHPVLRAIGSAILRAGQVALTEEPGVMDYNSSSLQMDFVNSSLTPALVAVARILLSIWQHDVGVVTLDEFGACIDMSSALWPPEVFSKRSLRDVITTSFSTLDDASYLTMEHPDPKEHTHIGPDPFLHVLGVQQKRILGIASKSPASLPYEVPEQLVAARCDCRLLIQGIDIIVPWPDPLGIAISLAGTRHKDAELSVLSRLGSGFMALLSGQSCVCSSYYSSILTRWGTHDAFAYLTQTPSLLMYMAFSQLMAGFRAPFYRAASPIGMVSLKGYLHVFFIDLFGHLICYKRRICDPLPCDCGLLNHYTPTDDDSQADSCDALDPAVLRAASESDRMIGDTQWAQDRDVGYDRQQNWRVPGMCGGEAVTEHDGNAHTVVVQGTCPGTLMRLARWLREPPNRPEDIISIETGVEKCSGRVMAYSDYDLSLCEALADVANLSDKDRPYIHWDIYDVTDSSRTASLIPFIQPQVIQISETQAITVCLQLPTEVPPLVGLLQTGEEDIDKQTACDLLKLLSQVSISMFTVDSASDLVVTSAMGIRSCTESNMGPPLVGPASIAAAPCLDGFLIAYVSVVDSHLTGMCDGQIVCPPCWNNAVPVTADVFMSQLRLTTVPVETPVLPQDEIVIDDKVPRHPSAMVDLLLQLVVVESYGDDWNAQSVSQQYAVMGVDLFRLLGTPWMGLQPVIVRAGGARAPIVFWRAPNGQVFRIKRHAKNHRGWHSKQTEVDVSRHSTISGTDACNLLPASGLHPSHIACNYPGSTNQTKMDQSAILFTTENGHLVIGRFDKNIRNKTTLYLDDISFTTHTPRLGSQPIMLAHTFQLSPAAMTLEWRLQEMGVATSVFLPGEYDKPVVTINGQRLHLCHDERSCDLRYINEAEPKARCPQHGRYLTAFISESSDIFIAYMVEVSDFNPYWRFQNISAALELDVLRSNGVTGKNEISAALAVYNEQRESVLQQPTALSQLVTIRAAAEKSHINDTLEMAAQHHNGALDADSWCPAGPISGFYDSTTKSVTLSVPTVTGRILCLRGTPGQAWAVVCVIQRSRGSLPYPRFMQPIFRAIAGCCIELTQKSHPDLVHLERLIEYLASESKAVRICTLGSLRVVLRQMIPGYRFLDDGSLETGGKDTRAERSWEKRFLGNYKEFIEKIADMTEAPSDDEAKQAITAAGDLLVAHPDFNYRDLLIRILLVKANSQRQALAMEAQHWMGELFATDKQGYGSLATLKGLNEIVKKRSLRSDILNPISRLMIVQGVARIDPQSGSMDPTVIKRQVKAAQARATAEVRRVAKAEKVNPGKAALKKARMEAEEHAQRVINSAIDSDADRRAVSTAQITTIVVMCSRIVRRQPESNLYSAALRILGRFSIYLEPHFVHSLIEILQNHLKEAVVAITAAQGWDADVELTPVGQRLAGDFSLCVDVIMMILQTLRLDGCSDLLGQEFGALTEVLYVLISTLGGMSMRMDDDIPRIMGATRQLFAGNTNLGPQIVASFVHRLFYLAASLPPHTAALVLSTARTIQRSALNQCAELYDHEKIAAYDNAQYNPLQPDPSLANPFGTTAWITTALSRSPSSEVRDQVKACIDREGGAGNRSTYRGPHICTAAIAETLDFLSPNADPQLAWMPPEPQRGRPGQARPPRRHKR